MNCNPAVLGDRIRTYSEAVEAVTHLDILRAVDMTVDNLVREQRMLRGYLRLAEDALDFVHSCDADMALDDDDDTAVKLLEGAEGDIAAMHADFERRMQAALDDDRLNGDHEEAVVNEYRETLDLLERMHAMTTKLRWAIMEHDADVDEVTGEFDNAEDLIAHLRRA
ncbi:MAG TPA: hypothetical protein ENK05_08710 [Gammaproteobacteria bacterium]|nr:hypothetical protein [Gammaproteobacteria bacterium]